MARAGAADTARAYLRRGLRSVGRGVGCGARVELDAELVLDDGGRNEPTPVQLNRAKRPAPDQVADAGLRHADHLGHFTGPVGHPLERPLYGLPVQLRPTPSRIAGCCRHHEATLPSLPSLSKTVSRPKETNPYESTAITGVRGVGVGSADS